MWPQFFYALPVQSRFAEAGRLYLSKNPQSVCINRYDGFINWMFLDWSVGKVGLKEPWKLKWHRNYDINASLPDWPDWMRRFKEY